MSIKRLLPILAVLISLVLQADLALAATDIKANVEAIGYGGGGRFTAVAVHPQNSDIVFVGSDVAGVFKSMDGGRTFQLKGNGLRGFQVADIAVHPISANWVFALTNFGLFASDDLGEHWTLRSAAVRYRTRISGSRLILFSKFSLWVGTDQNGVFQISVDEAAPVLSPVKGLEGIKVNGLTAYKNQLYAATEKGVYRYQKKRWIVLNQGLAAENRNVVDITGLLRQGLYISEQDRGVYAWSEEKSKWEHRPVSRLVSPKAIPEAFKAVAVHPADPQKLLLGTDPNSWPHLLFKSDNGGRKWQRIDSFELAPDSPDYWVGPQTVSSIEEIGFARGYPDLAYLTDWWSVWKSADGGQHWQHLHRGLQNTVVNDIKTLPGDSRHLFLCAWDNGLMVTQDKSGVWRRNMPPKFEGHAQELEISQRNPRKFYLLNDHWFTEDKFYVYKSTDGGKKWQDISFKVPANPPPKFGYISRMATNLEIDPGNDEIVYVGTNGYGVFKTTDGGKNWRAMNSGLRTPYIKGPGALLIHPRNPRVLFASTQDGGIYKTDDGGQKWRNVQRQHLFTFGMAINPADPKHIVAGAAQKTVLSSRDGGETWRAVRLPGSREDHIASFAIAFHPINSNIMSVGTFGYDNKPADGLFVSKDGGRRFVPVPMDLPKLSITEIYMPETNDIRMLVGYSGIGIYQVTLQD